ncbi:hypothetical protein EDC01DRAFT_756087 [Geopyxis carbonaria]|nr:hypothetical protein EDC01DRAFT_756087 [Geopyxis carbonaria]
MPRLDLRTILSRSYMRAISFHRRTVENPDPAQPADKPSARERSPDARLEAPSVPLTESKSDDSSSAEEPYVPMPSENEALMDEWERKSSADTEPSKAEFAAFLADSTDMSEKERQAHVDLAFAPLQRPRTPEVYVQPRDDAAEFAELCDLYVCKRLKTKLLLPLVLAGQVVEHSFWGPSVDSARNDASICDVAAYARSDAAYARLVGAGAAVPPARSELDRLLDRAREHRQQYLRAYCAAEEAGEAEPEEVKMDKAVWALAYLVEEEVLIKFVAATISVTLVDDPKEEADAAIELWLAMGLSGMESPEDFKVYPRHVLLHALMHWYLHQVSTFVVWTERQVQLSREAGV